MRVPIYKPVVVPNVRGFEIHKYYWMPSQENPHQMEFGGIVERGIPNQDVSLFISVLDGTDAATEIGTEY